jgi:3-hydroxyisobutyrate dehydrogenase-like beta-hydroxyacid dehydrogenase
MLQACAALLAGPGPGDAARAKLMLQIMMGNMVGALAEMMALTRAAGLDEGRAHSLAPHSTSARDRFTTRSFHLTVVAPQCRFTSRSFHHA